MYKIIKEKAIPIIKFIEVIKLLIDNEDFKTAKPSKTDKAPAEDKTDWIAWIIEKLGWAKEMFDKFSTAFIKSLKTLLPDIITGKNFLEVLKQFIEYLRTLNNSQKAMLFIKLASLMLINLSPEKKYKETESDFIIQTAYTHEKLFNNI